MSFFRPGLLSLLATLILIPVHAQSIQRQSIGSLGSSSTTGTTYIQECVGQAFQTPAGSTLSWPGFIQPATPTAQIQLPQLKVKAYPVPVTGPLKVVWEGSTAETQLTIYNIHGIIVEETLVRHVSHHTLDLIELPAGTYFLTIQQGPAIHKTTIIKQ